MMPGMTGTGRQQSNRCVRRCRSRCADAHTLRISAGAVKLFSRKEKNRFINMTNVGSTYL
jgi:hypothetical protein